MKGDGREERAGTMKTLNVAKDHRVVSEKRLLINDPHSVKVAKRSLFLGG